MEIIICIVLLCAFLVGLNFFSKWYIQFVYKKMYLDHKNAIDEIVNNTAIPSDWKGKGKASCIKKISKLERFVKQDKFYSPSEKELIIEVLQETSSQWKDCSESFFS